MFDPYFWIPIFLSTYLLLISGNIAFLFLQAAVQTLNVAVLYRCFYDCNQNTLWLQVLPIPSLQDYKVDSFLHLPIFRLPAYFPLVKMLPYCLFSYISEAFNTTDQDVAHKNA